jgi:hypothetical protein
VFLEEPGPILCSGGVVVGHPPLNAPGGFEITLPGLALLDLQLADAKRPVDGLCPITPVLRTYPVRVDNTGGNISVLCMLGYEPSIFYTRQSAV